MSEEVFKKIEQVLKEVKPSSSIKLERHLQNDLGLDSVDLLSFFFDLEKLFDVKIPQVDVENYQLLTIKNIVEYIEKIREPISESQTDVGNAASD